MIVGRSPRLIYSHKHCLIEPNLPKYVPFTRLDGLIVLNFEIPAHVFLPPQSALPTTKSPIDPTVLSLQASMYHPFAGLTFNRHPLSTSRPEQVSFPSPQASPSVSDAMAAADLHKHADSDVRSNIIMGVVLHGGDHAQVDMDDVVLHGGADTRGLVPVNVTVDGIVNGDVEEQAAANMYGNDWPKSDSLETLNLSLDFFDL